MKSFFERVKTTMNACLMLCEIKNTLCYAENAHLGSFEMPKIKAAFGGRNPGGVGFTISFHGFISLNLLSSGLFKLTCGISINARKNASAPKTAKVMKTALNAL